jgi:hypothetical protein
MKRFDESPLILQWSSEETVIPYVSPVDGRPHRYFPDFIIKVKTAQGIKTYVVEVKPQKQTEEPTKKSRKTKKYITEVATYAVNQAKWNAAEEYCLDRGWEFKVLTENDLGIK